MNDNEMNTTPVTPSEGAADPQTGVGPATTNPTKGESNPESESDNLTHSASEYSRLDKAVHDLGEVIIHTVDDLIPLLAEMKKVLSRKACTRKNNDGLPMWGEYLDTIAAEFSLSKRTLLRKLHVLEHPNELEDDDEEDSDEPEESEGEETEEEGGGKEEDDDDDSPVIYDSPKEQVTKWIARQRKVLSGGDGPTDANPVRDGERRIDTALQLLDEFQLALDEGLLDPTPQVASLRHEINQHQRDTKLRVVPLHLHQANALVAKLHRHHSPIRVAKFSIGAMIGDKLIGAAICMRPASRALDDGKTIEVARVAVEEPTDGPTDLRRNCCSFLYSACARISREMGFFKIQSYILQDEPGMTLRGAGWVCERTNCGGTKQGLRKNRPNGHKITPVTFKKKQRWAKILNTQADKKAESSITPTVESQKKPVASLRVFPSPTPCGGCKDMHRGIAEMAAQCVGSP